MSNQEDLIKFSNTSNDLTEDLLNAKKRFLTSYVLAPLTSDQRYLLETELANQSVLSCYFNEEINNIQEEINNIQIKKYENEPAFIQFNTNKKVNKYSILNMELFTGLTETQSPTMNIDETSSSGVVLFIHDDPRLIITSDEQGIQLRPGYHSHIIISKKVVKTLDEPYNYCVNNIDSMIPPMQMKDRTLFDLTFNLTGFYSQKYCFQLCYQKTIVKNCGCYDRNVIKYKNYENNLESCGQKFSDNETNYLDDEDYSLSCPYLIKESFYASDYVQKCSFMCPKECVKTSFKPVLSQSKYPSYFYMNVLLNNYRLNEIFIRNINEPSNEKRIKESIVSFSIKIDFDYFIEIEEVPDKTIFGLISELGENLGLFLGLSILSCFEIVDLLLKILILIFKKLFIVFEMKLLIIIHKLLFKNNNIKRQAIQ